MRYSVIGLIMIVMCSVTSGKVQTKEIEYRHGDTVLQGHLAWDDAIEGKRPGVLVVHEWWGNNEYSRHRAEQLAELGYVGFAIDMFGKGITTTDPKEAGKLATAIKSDRQLMRDRAAAGLATLREQELVDSAHIAAIGYCFGGTTALELARSGADIVGVVSFHGGLDAPSPAAEIKAAILVCHGADDTFISDDELMAFRKEMQDTKADWQMEVYGGAAHSFTNPNADKAGIKGVAYNEKADRRSWEAMKLFFNEILQK